MSIKNKINRLKPHLTKNEHSQPAKAALADSLDVSIPFLDIWKEENVTPFYFDNSYCMIREVKYPITHRHGKYSFKDFLTAVHKWNEKEVPHPISAIGHAPEDLFFFDTETTGLGGGTGNTIFILGSARFSRDYVLLKQHILPHPGAEVPLYKSFLEEVDYTTLVTYNGKAFDWPQVKTRHTLIREHLPKLPSFGHFDLYHASRRMWKHRLDKLKLSVVEKDILEITRENDIPGFLAPMIYFDFVENKQPEGMLGVIKHNEIDILSLITLYTHLSFQLLGIDHLQSNREILEVGKWYSSIGETTAAKNAFKKIADLKEVEGLKAKHALAFEYKRQKKWKEARLLWTEISEEALAHEVLLEAYIELAKIYEHREKDYEKALECSTKAKETEEGNHTPFQRNHAHIAKRISRLELKIAKNTVV